MISELNVRLCLAPITKEEATAIEKKEGDYNLYVLYTGTYGSVIRVGMLSSDIRKKIPQIANVGGVDISTKTQLFYSGGDDLKKQARIVDDRPVYDVEISENRTAITATSISNIDTSLCNVVKGEYILKPEALPALDRTVFQKAK